MKQYFNSFFLLLFLSSCLQANDIYVSTKGDDNSSGSSAAKAVKSIQKAIALAEQARKSTKEQINIHVSEGEYYIDKSIHITNKLSDIAIVGKGNVLFSGAKVADQWEKVNNPRFSHVPKGSLWRTPLPKTSDGFRLVKVIYDAEGNKLPRAIGKGFVPDKCPSMAALKDAEKDLYYRFFHQKTKLFFKSGDVLAYDDVENAELRITPKQQWLMNILPIKEIDVDKGELITEIPATYTMLRVFASGSKKEVDGKVLKGVFESAWIENVAAVLDQPNEWVADAKEGYLYLYAKTKPSGIRIPTTVELFKLEGQLDEKQRKFTPVKNVTFTGISFQFTDRKTKDKNSIALQHDWEEQDASTAVIRLRCAERVKITNCEFKNIGGTGVRMDTYAQYNEVSHCHFHKVGNTCVLLDGYGPGTLDVNKHNTVHNNKMHHFGDLVWHGCAVHIFQSGENKITNNHVFDGPYNGIVLSGVRGRWLPEFRGGTIHFSKHESNNKLYPKLIDERVETIGTVRWDEINSPKNWVEYLPFLHTRNNLVQDNEIHDVVTKLGDGNGIYASAVGGGNLYKRNLIYNVRSIQPARSDDDAMGDTYEQNIFVNTTGGRYAALRIKQLNSVVNNLFIYNLGPGMSLGAWSMATPSVVQKAEIKHNMFFYIGEEQRQIAFNIKDRIIEHNKALFNELDYSAKDNYFFSYKKPDKNPAPVLQVNKNWETTVNVKDPKFNDFDHWDLGLQKDSPLLNSGWESIDYAKIGNIEDPAFERLQKEGLPKALGNYYYDLPREYYNYDIE